MNTHKYCGNMQLIDSWHYTLTSCIHTISWYCNLSCRKEQMRIIHATKYIDVYSFHAFFSRMKDVRKHLIPFLWWRLICIKMSFNTEIYFIPYVTSVYIYFVLPFINLSLLIKSEKNQKMNNEISFATFSY